MKRHCLPVFVMLLFLMACSESKEGVSSATGVLYVASAVEGVDFSTTRAEADVNQFTLVLENESNPEVLIAGLFSDFPDGTIRDIPVGSYGLSLTSHPDGFVPAFEDPWYQGLKGQIPIASGRTTMVNVECVQANAGITFIYDASLEQVGLGGIVPEMTQGGTTLYFEGEHRDAKAYFLPEQVELKIKHGDEYLMIGGKESQMLDLGKEQLWETTLKATQITGKVAILATVKVIAEPTHVVEFELGQSDLVGVTGLGIGSHTASFLAKGDRVEALRFGLFATASVDFMLGTGLSSEELMDRNGTELGDAYLRQLNSGEGLVLEFDRMTPETAYTLLIMSTRNAMKLVQRYDFVTAEGIGPDPVQSPDGPIVPGVYTLNIYQEELDGVYSYPYENEINVIKAVQDNTYIINNLFLASDIDLVAKYDGAAGKLTFTGKDVMGNDIFNKVAFVLNDGEYYAGIYLSDGVDRVDDLVFVVEDRKLSKVATVMEFRLFDPFTENDLGWLEISPLNNPFTFAGSFAKADWTRVAPLRNEMIRFTHTSPLYIKGKTGVRSSVSVLSYGK